MAKPKQPVPSRSSGPILAIVLVSAILAAVLLFRSSEPPAQEAVPEPAPAAAVPQPAAVPVPVSTTIPAEAPIREAQAAQPPPRTQPARPAPSTAAPARAGKEPPLPPLPLVSYPAPRPPEVIQAVYTFAARHPEVLAYVPCFCGCERDGHKNNEHCFVAARDAEGRVTWDAHGIG